MQAAGPKACLGRGRLSPAACLWRKQAAGPLGPPHHPHSGQMLSAWATRLPCRVSLQGGQCVRMPGALSPSFHRCLLIRLRAGCTQGDCWQRRPQAPAELTGSGGAPVLSTLLRPPLLIKGCAASPSPALTRPHGPACACRCPGSVPAAGWDCPGMVQAGCWAWPLLGGPCCGAAVRPAWSPVCTARRAPGRSRTTDAPQPSESRCVRPGCLPGAAAL